MWPLVSTAVSYSGGLRLRPLLPPVILALLAAGAVTYYRLTRSPAMEEFDRLAADQPCEREDRAKEVTRSCPPLRRPELLR
jgi:hypothetical protein